MDGAKARAGGWLAVATTVDAAELDAARLGLDRARPQHSARRTLHVAQAFWLTLIAGLFGFALYSETRWTLASLHVGALVFFAAAILVRLLAAARLTPVLSRLAEPPQWPRYTILCPLHREANIAADLISALTRLDYPVQALQILILTESDDEDTTAAALAASAGLRHVEVVVVPAAAPRTKPKALNIGLARARGKFLVVYDAEDRPHPQQLRAALAAFEDGGERLACVQAPLVVDNAEASWIARQFAAEYAIQFREILPFLADLGLPLPLGGASNHFRTAALRATGGWDAFNVSEDRANFANKLNRFRTRTFHIPFVSHSCASAA